MCYFSFGVLSKTYHQKNSLTKIQIHQATKYYIESRILARLPETEELPCTARRLYLSHAIRVCNHWRKFRSYVTNRNYGGPILEAMCPKVGNKQVKSTRVLGVYKPSRLWKLGDLYNPLLHGIEISVSVVTRWCPPTLHTWAALCTVQNELAPSQTRQFAAKRDNFVPPVSFVARISGGRAV